MYYNYLVILFVIHITDMQNANAVSFSLTLLELCVVHALWIINLFLFVTKVYWLISAIYSHMIVVILTLIRLLMKKLLALLFISWLAVSTRPLNGVVLALRASILSALAGLCRPWTWPWLKHSSGQHESLCQVWSWSAQPFGRPSVTDKQTNKQTYPFIM